MKIEQIEKELVIALYRFSYGRLTAQEAAEKAQVIAPKIDTSNPMIGHKGINWYAKQVLRASGNWNDEGVLEISERILEQNKEVYEMLAQGEKE